MLVNELVLARHSGPLGYVHFNVETGEAREFLGTTHVKESGNLYTLQGNTFALYAQEGVLYFQWNKRRWDIVSLCPIISYRHDFQRRTTTFSIEDMKIEYPAWWKDDPAFDPCIPERDEEEDYLGYICAVSQSKTLQQALAQGWGN
jgi:hypothetical protein